MLGQIEVFLSHEYTFAKEVLVNLFAISLRDKPSQKMLVCHRNRASGFSYIVASSWRSSGNRTQRWIDLMIVKVVVSCNDRRSLSPKIRMCD